MRMTKDESQMTKEARKPKYEDRARARGAGFGIRIAAVQGSLP